MFTVQEHSLPDFEVDEEPQAIPVIRHAGSMFVRETAEGTDVEQPSLERSRGEDELAHDRPEGPTKPSADGNRESHFAPMQDGARDDVGEGPAKDRLGAPPAQLDATR
jgi:hypothetical protein